MEKPVLTCTKCGEEYRKIYDEEIGKIMHEQGVCFLCAFWTWQYSLDQGGQRNYAIIDGSHYVLYPHTDINWPVGMGGTKYRIRFFDGRVVDCDNLWCQGIIPDRFRDIMPDNAEFVPAIGD